MATDATSRFAPEVEQLSLDDFETASIRSAAPSYSRSSYLVGLNSCDQDLRCSAEYLRQTNPPHQQHKERGKLYRAP